MHNRSILSKVLIDSGNLFGDLISEEFATLLKLKLHGTERSVGTAAANGCVTILGKTAPVKLYLEGISEAVTIHPYVVRKLAHPINLGQAFLRRHQADMSFREKGIQLRIKNSTAMLTTANTSLTRATIDARIKQVLEKFKAEGENPWSDQAEILDLRVQTIGEENTTEHNIPGLFYKTQKKSIEFSSTTTRVCNHQKVKLPANTTQIVVL